MSNFGSSRLARITGTTFGPRGDRGQVDREQRKLALRPLLTPMAELTDREMVAGNWSVQTDLLDPILSFISRHFDPLSSSPSAGPKGSKARLAKHNGQALKPARN